MEQLKQVAGEKVLKDFELGEYRKWRKDLDVEKAESKRQVIKSVQEKTKLAADETRKRVTIQTMRTVIDRDTKEQRNLKARTSNEKADTKAMEDQSKILTSEIVAIKGDTHEARSKVSRVKAETSSYESKIMLAKNSESQIKEDIKATVDLGDKYGASDDGTDPVDPDENDESVTELAARISQMEIEITILNDELASGKSGIPKDTQIVHQELQKVIAKLKERKASLEDEKKQRAMLREDLQRVQTMIVSQREEIEKEIETLAQTVNTSNLDITRWLSYSNASDSWEETTTFMSRIKSQYL